jgi:hypothetical protein
MKFLLSLILACVFCVPAIASKNFIDEVASLGDVAAFDFTNEVTLSLKLYRRANSPSIQGLITKGRTDFTQPMLYGLYFEANALKFCYANPNGTYFTFTSTGTFPQTNTAIHVAAKYQYSITASMALFVNGERVAGAWDVGPTVVGLVNANAFQIGVLNTAAQGISGRVADVAVWNAYLTDRQISMLHHGPKRTPLLFPTGLKAYWPFDDGSEQGGTNIRFRLVDWSPIHEHSFVGGGSGPIISDGFTGYQPNE